MKISKKYFNEVAPNKYLQKCKQQNSILIKQVLRNNSFLLKKNNLTLKFQIQKLRGEGVKISPSGISRYKRGVYKTCALTYLQIFAEFWSVSLLEMMSYDFDWNYKKEGWSFFLYIWSDIEISVRILLLKITTFIKLNENKCNAHATRGLSLFSLAGCRNPSVTDMW